MISVGLFGAPLMLSYVLLGVLVDAPRRIAGAASRKPRKRPAAQAAARTQQQLPPPPSMPGPRRR